MKLENAMNSLVKVLPIAPGPPLLGSRWARKRGRLSAPLPHIAPGPPLPGDVGLRSVSGPNHRRRPAPLPLIATGPPLLSATLG